MSRRFTVIDSFEFAINGLKTAVAKEPNFQIHTVVGLTAIILGIFFKFTVAEWVTLLFTISLVLIFELLNTAVEALTNLFSPEINEYAKVAKDVSAAAVLITAVNAVLVGILLFLPKILTFI